MTLPGRVGFLFSERIVMKIDSASINLQQGIPSKRESSARDDYEKPKSLGLAAAHGLCPWPLPMVTAHGQSMGIAHDQCPWALPMSIAHGRCPWPLLMAIAHGHCPWPSPMAISHGHLHGLCPWPFPMHVAHDHCSWPLPILATAHGH